MSEPAKDSPGKKPAPARGRSPAAPAAPEAPKAQASLDAMRQLKELEAEMDVRIQTLRSDAERVLRHLEEESQGAIQKARAEAERALATAIEEARRAATAEGSRLISAARETIEARPKGLGFDIASRRDRILAALAPEFL